MNEHKFRSELPAEDPDHRVSSNGGSARSGVGFWSLVVTQFQGAFNDNALKFLVIYLIVEMGLPGRQRDWLVLVVGALFALPFIFFSMTGGYLADRFSKRSVTIGTKWMELGAMIFSLVALARGNIAMEFVGVFALSSQAALFGPSKYGLLPEILPEKDLSWGNGIIELGTFLAAISATVASGYLAFYFRGRQGWSGSILIGCTLLGLAASYAISHEPAANPERKFSLNPLGDFFEQLRVIRADRILGWAVVGNAYLWFLAALLQFTIVIYGHDVLRIDERHISYLQAAVAIGIGFGSFITGYLSDQKIEYGLVPLGAIGMTAFGFLSASHGLSLEKVGLYLGLLGFFGGFYAVPLNALIQHRPHPESKGSVIAVANLISFVGVFFAAGVYFVLAQGLHLRADKVFFAGACMTLAATFYAIALLPDSVLRLVLWALSHSVYRIRVIGRDNIPERGGALFLADHITLLDALLLSASTDRSIRFLLDRKRTTGQPPFLERIMLISRFSLKERPGEVLNAAANAFNAGEVVCLETAETLALKNGSGQREGFEKLLGDAGAPIVAVSLKGAMTGALGAQNGHVYWKKPAQLPSHVTVQFGSPLSPCASATELRQAFESLDRSLNRVEPAHAPTPAD